MKNKGFLQILYYTTIIILAAVTAELTITSRFEGTHILFLLMYGVLAANIFILIRYKDGIPLVIFPGIYTIGTIILFLERGFGLGGAIILPLFLFSFFQPAVIDLLRETFPLFKAQLIFYIYNFLIFLSGGFVIGTVLFKTGENSKIIWWIRRFLLLIMVGLLLFSVHACTITRNWW